MTRLNAADARRDFDATLDRVARKRERIILQREGKDVAAIVPVEDLEDLEALEEEEDREDVEAAEKALAEPGERPYEEVRRELGLE